MSTVSNSTNPSYSTTNALQNALSTGAKSSDEKVKSQAQTALKDLQALAANPSDQSAQKKVQDDFQQLAKAEGLGDDAAKDLSDAAAHLSADDIASLGQTGGQNDLSDASASANSGLTGGSSTGSTATTGG